MNNMQSNIHILLLDRIMAVKETYLRLDNDGKRKDLLMEAVKDTIGPDGIYKTNFTNIIDYYVTTGRLDLEKLIVFLSKVVDNPVDNQSWLRETNEDFDSRFNTETSTVIYQYELPEKVSVERFENAHKYAPSPIGAINTVLTSLPSYNVDYSDYIFIDIGSGMGRNLLLASHYPFKKIMGVEISDHLHNIAISNVEKYKDPAVRCSSFDLKCMNAVDFEFPEDNMVLYFYEPFSSKVAEAFINKLEAFLKGKTLKVVLCFIPVVYNVVKNSKVFTLRDRLTTSELLVSLEGYFTYSIYTN